eukprot:GHRQ01011076.1.p1 GENE.GHRQ01011076.1~~GHRQ01011076.1.p1  ORF type:complete len:216 (+),score=55.91 GHRQ01011076.1:228-875(+)
MQHQHVVCQGWRRRPLATPQLLQQHRPTQQRRPQHRQQAACYASSSSIGAEEAKRLIEREGYKILDVRSARDYDAKHITKPARCSINAPVVQNDNVTPNAQFVAEVAAQASKASKLLVMCADGGALSDSALTQLAESAYSGAVRLQGGYAGWSEVWSPSGKRRPPPGRWVSTGKEALKSGLNIPGVAESYDEGGNLTSARWAKGLQEGEQLPPSW